MTIAFVIYVSVFFFLSEFVLMIVKRSKKTGTKAQNDRLSLLLFWIAIPVCLSLGFFNAKYSSWDVSDQVIACLGLCVVLIGITIRWWAILQLKKEFTVDVAIGDRHHLKTNGLYSYIRHPSYLGLLLICLGLSVAMNSWLSLLVITIPIFLVIIYRIKVEESILTKEFGDAYRDYMRNTRRIIPLVY